MTQAQTEMLKKAAAAKDWHLFHCALYTVARALHRRGLVDLHNFRGGKYGVRITDAGRVALGATPKCINPRAREAGWGVAFCQCLKCEAEQAAHSPAG